MAEIETAMGPARVEYRALYGPDGAVTAQLLTQTMPGGGGVMEIGSVGGNAWMGEPGRPRPADPAMARELAGGGDLQMLVRGIAERFEECTVVRKEQVGDRSLWVIEMRPKTTSPAPATGAAQQPPAWTLRVDEKTSLPASIEMPAANQPGAPRNPQSTGAPATQRIEFSDWKPIAVGDAGGPEARDRLSACRPLAFTKAVVTNGGMKTTLVYGKVALNTLRPGSIEAPAQRSAPAPQPSSPQPPAPGG